MSGHSKWANIKNRKGAQDKKRSVTFTKVAKDILTAIRTGGGKTNLEANLHLKTAIEKAREVNMPKENIERLIANFEERKANMATYVFEGYGPHSVPFIIETETDNKNRTLTDLKLIFRDCGGSLVEGGSVLYQFDKRGEIEVESIPPEKELELIDAGVEDISGNMVYVDPLSLSELTDKIKKLGIKVIKSELVMISKMPLLLKTEEMVADVLDLVDILEENDDVVNVFTGFDYV